MDITTMEPGTTITAEYRVYRNGLEVGTRTLWAVLTRAPYDLGNGLAHVATRTASFAVIARSVRLVEPASQAASEDDGEISDGTLNGWQDGSIPVAEAFVHAVAHLRPLSAPQRRVAIREAFARRYFEGGSPSNAIAAACVHVAQGRTPFTHRAARELGTR